MKLKPHYKAHPLPHFCKQSRTDCIPEGPHDSESGLVLRDQFRIREHECVIPKQFPSLLRVFLCHHMAIRRWCAFGDCGVISTVFKKPDLGR